MTPIRYDQRSYWVKWDTMTCSLATIAGLIVLPFIIAPTAGLIVLPFIIAPISGHAWKYVGYRLCSADLCYRRGCFTPHIVVDVPDPVVARNDTVVGINLGRGRLAVTSTRQFLGEKRRKEQERRSSCLRRKPQAGGNLTTDNHYTWNL